MPRKPRPPKKQQRNRHLKCECPRCGYTVRTSRKWLLQAGAPVCPVDQLPMVPEAGSIGSGPIHS